MEAKRQAAIAALRGERNVAEPSPTGEATSQAPAAPVSAQPTPPESPAGMTAAQVKDILAAYDSKIAEARALEAQNSARAAEITAKAAEAAEKVKKIEQAKADPLQFLAEAGITDAEWQAMLRGGGELTAEQRQLKELKAEIEAIRADSARKDAESAQRARRDAARAYVDANPLTKSMTNADSLLARQAEMSKAAGKEVALPDVVADLTNTYKTGLKNLLNNPEVLAMLDISVPKPQSGSAVSTSPTTLSSKLASSTSPSDGKPGPLDWAAKKALFLKRLADESKR